MVLLRAAGRTTATLTTRRAGLVGHDHGRRPAPCLTTQAPDTVSSATAASSFATSSFAATVTAAPFAAITTSTDLAATAIASAAFTSDASREQTDLQRPAYHVPSPHFPPPAPPPPSLRLYLMTALTCMLTSHLGFKLSPLDYTQRNLQQPTTQEISPRKSHMYLPYLKCISVNISYESRIINQYHARHSYKKNLQGYITRRSAPPQPTHPHTRLLKTSSSTSPPFPTGGEWDHPPLRGWPRRSAARQPTHPHTRHHHLRHHPSPQGESGTTPPAKGVATTFNTATTKETKPPNPPPVGKAGFEVWVLTKGGLVSVHHCRLYCTVVHAHRVRGGTLTLGCVRV